MIKLKEKLYLVVHNLQNKTKISFNVKEGDNTDIVLIGFCLKFINVWQDYLNFINKLESNKFKK